MITHLLDNAKHKCLLRNVVSFSQALKVYLARCSFEPNHLSTSVKINSQSASRLVRS